MTFQIEATLAFTEWLKSLTDGSARLRILARLQRAELGNLGDWKALSSTPGLFEMRIHYGPGYRVYFARRGQAILVILGGSTKADQRAAIAAAAHMLNDI